MNTLSQKTVGYRILRFFQKNYGFFLLASALTAVLYYIFGPARVEFHADCTDTFLWALTSVESGKWIDPDFSYACILPFGGSLLMLLWYPFFGLSMLTHQLGIATFTILLSAACLWALTHMEFSKNGAACATAAFLLLVTGSEKIREIFFGHIIYYSLGILFLLVAFALFRPLWEAADPRSDKPWGIPFFVRYGIWMTFLFLCALNGTTALLLCIFPLLFLAVFTLLTDRETKLFSSANAMRFGLLLSCLMASLAGVLVCFRLQVDINAGYANAYSSFVNDDEWRRNITGLIGDFCSLFGVPAPQTSFASFQGIDGAFRLAGGLLLLSAPVISLFLFRFLKGKGFRQFLLCVYAMDGTLLFVYLFGALGSANWRLTPFLATSVLIFMGLIREGLASLPAPGTSYSVAKRFACAFALFAVLLSALHLNGIRLLSNNTADNPHYGISDYLQAQDLSYGFATFWNANNLTLISDGALRVHSIQDSWNGGTQQITPYHYQSAGRHYQEEHDNYFILLTASEYSRFCRTSFAIQIPPYETLTYTDPVYEQIYYILLYQQNPITVTVSSEAA